MTTQLLLDEHYAEAIAARLREVGHDVVAAVSDPDLRGASDEDIYRRALEHGRRVVTENIKDFRPLLLQHQARGIPAAPLLLVPPRRFPRGRGDRAALITAALHDWLTRPNLPRPVEDWLT